MSIPAWLEAHSIYKAALTQSFLQPAPPVKDRRHLGAEKLYAMAAASSAIGHKLNADQSVAVATDVFFDEDMTRCPVGVKVQLLGAGGVASYGVYNSRDPFWIGWAPVPKRRPR